jgi:hypothetical protein
MKMMSNEITTRDVLLIKHHYEKMQDPKEDRRDHLDVLFDMHTKYTMKIWSTSSRTCGSCVSQVKRWAESLISKNNG